MNFVIDPILEVTRQQYKKEYDENLAKMRKTKAGSPERLALHKEEMRLHQRTKGFLESNSYYFTMKRKYLFAVLEQKGIFGDRPFFEVQPDLYGRSRVITPQQIKRRKICVECGKDYVWYETRPTVMCTECRTTPIWNS